MVGREVLLEANERGLGAMRGRERVVHVAVEDGNEAGDEVRVARVRGVELHVLLAVEARVLEDEHLAVVERVDAVPRLLVAGRVEVGDGGVEQVGEPLGVRS